MIFHMHKWGNWISKGKVRSYANQYHNRPYKIVETYKGTCSVCGMITFKKVEL